MDKKFDFELKDFMPYLLNQAADATSRQFETNYKSKYGMLRTEWRVVFHLGSYGKMTAKEICDRAHVHKTKVSRAVHSLDAKKLLHRKPLENDKRHEILELTKNGIKVFADLHDEARRFDGQMMAAFSPSERDQIRQFLIRIAGI